MRPLEEEERPQAMYMRYPDIRVPLTGRDWDTEGGDYYMTAVTFRSSSILARVRKALKLGGVSDEEIEEYTREATSRRYNHLLFTTITWVETR